MPRRFLRASLFSLCVVHSLCTVKRPSSQRSVSMHDESARDRMRRWHGRQLLFLANTELAKPVLREPRQISFKARGFRKARAGDAPRRSAAFELRLRKDRRIKDLAERGVGLGGIWVKLDPMRKATMEMYSAVRDIQRMRAERGCTFVPHKRHPAVIRLMEKVLKSMKEETKETIISDLVQTMTSY